MTARRDHSKEVIMRVLHIEHNAWNNLLLDEGQRYVRLYMDGDAAGQELLLSMPEYWAWWRRTWNQRARQFVQAEHLDDDAYVVDKWARSQLLQLWYARNDAECVGVTPSSYVRRRIHELHPNTRK